MLEVGQIFEYDENNFLTIHYKSVNGFVVKKKKKN